MSAPCRWAAGAGALGAGLLCAGLALAADAVRRAPAPRPVPAQAQAQAGDPVAGQQKAEAGRCLECHATAVAETGDGSASHARLAGQMAPYLVKQLQDFRRGLRRHDVMRLMTLHLDDTDMRDIAAWFAGLAPMHGTGMPDLPARHEEGLALFTRADPAGSCAACHGPTGRGLPATAAPRLAGQDPRYLEQQLLDWRSGWRHNAADGVMNRVTKSLSDAQILALAHYLAAQP